MSTLARQQQQLKQAIVEGLPPDPTLLRLAAERQPLLRIGRAQIFFRCLSARPRRKFAAHGDEPHAREHRHQQRQTAEDDSRKRALHGFVSTMTHCSVLPPFAPETVAMGGFDPAPLGRNCGIPLSSKVHRAEQLSGSHDRAPRSLRRLVRNCGDAPGLQTIFGQRFGRMRLSRHSCKTFARSRQRDSSSLPLRFRSCPDFATRRRR